MVDARLPGPWLHRPEYWELSDHAWRVFTHGLMWSADNGTDGRIPPAFLTMLHRAGVPDEVADELVGRGHWERTADGGFQVIDWAGRKGQSTDAEVQAHLARKRANQAAYRARKAVAEAASGAGRVTGHGRIRVTGHVGAARPGPSVSSVSPPPPDQGGGGGETRHDPRVRAGARETPPGPKPATCDQPQHTRVELTAAGICPSCRAEQVADDTRWAREDQARRASAPPRASSRAAAPVPARTPAAAPAAVAPAPVPAAAPVTAPAPVPAPVPTAPPGLHLVTANRRGRPRPQTNPPWRQLALRLFVQPIAPQPTASPLQAQPEPQPAAAAAAAA